MTAAQEAVAIIAERCPGPPPRLAVVLGSGLGDLAALLVAPSSVDYTALPGFPRPGVEGHAGRLLCGSLAGLPVMLLLGRAHLYESGRADAMATPIAAITALGCERLILTNAAGSLRAEMIPGSVMLVNDHVNFTGLSPLFGATGNSRFVDMSTAYDPDLSQQLRCAAGASGDLLHEGVYGWFAGPQFETPAEVRAAGRLGVDAVGMSTVPEVILARHQGLRVAALSIITNPAAGLGARPLDHARTQVEAAAGAAVIARILTVLAGALATEEPAHG